MIVAFTPNPSIDRTVSLGGALARGEVQRATSVIEQAAGKGANVAQVVHAAGLQALSVAAFEDAAYTAVAARQPGRPDARAATVSGEHYSARVNTAITEPDGTTTKINEPGPWLSEAQIGLASDLLVDAARGAQWAVLSGSLPPGAPDDWYATLVRRLRVGGTKVAVDTSDAALDALLDALPEASFDLIKPNSDELAQLTGGDAAAFEASAKAGDLDAIVDAARSLQGRGITNVLVTLGGSGAVLVNAEGAWYAAAPAIEVASTVGAGDSSVAGFIIADAAGSDPAGCLASAVAHGSAAASLPGTGLPTPEDVHVDAVIVRALV